MIEEPTDESSLKGLADAIKLLYDTGIKEWTADDVISLIDELSGKITFITESNRNLLEYSYKIIMVRLQVISYLPTIKCFKIFKELGIV